MAGPSTKKISFKLLDTFVAPGFNMVDTADVYSRWASGIGGESETILRSWMKKRYNHKDLIIATKVGKDMGNGKVGLSKKYILNAGNESLKRLQTDYIDLYQSHDDKTTPLEETVGAYQQLIKEGKIRFIGASNYTAERLKETLIISAKQNYLRYETLQPHYNLVERNLLEDTLEKVCLDNKLGAIPYYSLASGFLTGKYRSENDSSKSPHGKGASKYLNEKVFKILKSLEEISAKHKTKPAAVSLTWLITRPSITTPIGSATSVEQLKDLLQSEILTLDEKDILLLDKCSK